MGNLLGAFYLLDWLWLIILGLIIVALIVCVFFFVPVKVWYKNLLAGARISMVKFHSLKSRKQDYFRIANAYTQAKKGDVYLTVDDIESHINSGGNIERVINAVIVARNSKIDLSVETAKAIDLSGKDVLESVKSCVSPRVIETQKVSGICGDNFEVKLRARITVKAIITKLIGSAGEDTILSRVCEGLSTVIGSFESHTEVVQNPDLVSKILLTKHFEKGTCFEILSIDISSVELGKNNNIQNELDQVEIEKAKNNARIEERKSLAVAEEYELKVKAQRLKLEKLSAEAEIPKAIKKAFEEGKVNVLDYYKMQNIIADTKMRQSIAKDSKSSEEDDDEGYYD